MTALRVLLVDDEPLALRRLEQLMSVIANFEICGSASGCGEAVEVTRREKPDIVLLDIRMRDGSGFDYLAALPEECAPAIIFVTAFDAHAVDAFAHNALDYVLKPIDPVRLATALQRARQAINERDRARSTDELHEVIANLRAKIRADSGSAFETEIWIRKNVTGFLRLPVADIQSVTAEDDYVRINTAERSYLLRSTLGDLQAKLDPEQFFRIHRSAIVRRASVVEFKREGAGLHAYLTNGDRLRVGRVYAKLIRSDLTRLER